MNIRSLLAETNPKDNQKYSENLFKFLRNRHFYNRVYFDQVEAGPYSEARNLDSHIYLGVADDNSICGARLSEILSTGSKARTWAYPSAEGFQDITELFWAHYLIFGKCAIDPEHLLYPNSDRYKLLSGGSQRKCLWCGRTEILHIEERVVLIKNERWLEAV